MDRLKTFRKYIIWIIAFYIFSSLLIYIGLNATYKNIETNGTIPNQVNVEIAQATKVNGRIYGKVTSTAENDLNGKFIKVQIYNRRGALVGTKLLEITGTEVNEPKKFAVTFTAENIESYKIELLDSSEELKEESIRLKDIYKDVFTDEELKMYAIVLLVLGLIYAV